MKILIGCDTYYPMANGASYFTQRLAAGLAERGHEVHVVTPGQKTKDQHYIRQGVHVLALSSIRVPVYPGLRNTPPYVKDGTIDRYIAQVKPDIVHIQNHYLVAKAVAKSALKRNIPVVGTNHFMPENLVYYLHLPKSLERSMVMTGWKHFARTYRELDRITTPTKTAAEHIENLPLGLQLTAISCGIDLQRFNTKRDGEYLRAKYAIPAQRRIMLYVGRLDKEKRIEDVVRALPQIAQKVDVQFFIAGTGKRGKQIAQLATQLGVRDRVTLAGFVSDDDLPNLYGLAQVFVMAGIAELQSIVTMEAMASGLPVIAVNANALPELVHDGQNGFLFGDGNTDELARHAITLLSDTELAHKMGKESMKIVQAHDISKQLAAYEQLYVDVIEKKRERQPAKVGYAAVH